MCVFKTRYSILFSFTVLFLLLSLAVRVILTVLSWQEANLSCTELLVIYGKGFLYDLAVAFVICSFYTLYLLVIPERFNRSLANRVISYSGFFIILLICLFSFFAEFTFWKEFDSRFNFIAVDYLVYTYEVVKNVSQSYPLPKLFGSMLLIALAVTFLFEIRKVFYRSFYSHTPFKTRLKFSGGIILLALLLVKCLDNDWAEKGDNRYAAELSKSGIFSFFAAFKNNQLDYDKYYPAQNIKTAFATVKTELSEELATMDNDPLSIDRQIKNSGKPGRPNVIMITVESLSADFMEHFGNTQHLTPVLDSIADAGILFTDMYATGTRTVRGMEALTLSIPPTPGNSIVRRPHNQHLYCIASVFKQAGYARTFFYGGDGYFDNMNAFFGNNGFDIVDRVSHLVPGEPIDGMRKAIADAQVHFENAWGISDEDLYDAVIRDADDKTKHRELFYDFVMTTSNHRPYTYPPGRIRIPSGSGREGAVMYTDYAIGRFLQKIKAKPWFANTIIVFVADHCASSAGKNEINIAHYHIPCIIYNLKNYSPAKINFQCSQIDLYPTLFGLLHWQYETDFYGKNVLLASYRPRAFVGTYQQLGYLEGNNLLVLSPRKEVRHYRWDKSSNLQQPVRTDSSLARKTISFYQSASYLFKNGLLHDSSSVSTSVDLLGVK